MKQIIKGHGKPIICIIGCIHGNEMIGKYVIDRLKEVSIKKGTLILILANLKAITQKKRFIDTDLNRCFPGDKDGNHEEMLAKELYDTMKNCDYVLDVHSTTAHTENFIIITKDTDHIQKSAKYIPIKKIVKMESSISKGKAMIDYTDCGISIEFNLDTSIQKAKEIVTNYLKYLGLLEGYAKKTDQDIYSVYGVMKKGELKLSSLINFKQAEINGELFYPILFGEKEYKEVVCLKARKIS